MTVNLSNPAELKGATVTGAQNAKLGKVDDVYLDNKTSKPEWAAIKTSMFDGPTSFVPLVAADYTDGTLHLPYTKDQVQQAPHHDPGPQLSVDDEKRLSAHYCVAHEGDTATAKPGQGQQAPPAADLSAVPR